MSTITKEWLQQKIADMETARDDIPFGLSDDGDKTLAALRIALASLEAEAVGITDSSEIECLKRGEMANVMPPYYKGVDAGDEVFVYTAPPAPVSVPEWTNEQCLEFLSIAFRHAEIKGDLELDDIRLGVKMVNGSRAAMLQGADGNSPVIPDAYDIEAFGIFSATEGESGLLLQIEQFWFGTENCPQVGKENMVPKFALQAIINRLQAHCNSMGEDTLIDIFASSAAPQQEVKP